MAKAVTLKDKDGNVLYPTTSWDLVGGSESGWQLIAETKLTSNGTSLICTLPEQYDCYQIIASGEMIQGTSGSWVDLRFLNGVSGIPCTLQRFMVQGTTMSTTTHSAVNWQMSVVQSLNQYDSFIFKMTTCNKQRGANSRPFQGISTCGVSSFGIGIFNGRLDSATEPTAFQLIAGANMQPNSFIKVFACNKPS